MGPSDRGLFIGIVAVLAGTGLLAWGVTQRDHWERHQLYYALQERMDAMETRLTVRNRAADAHSHDVKQHQDDHHTAAQNDTAVFLAAMLDLAEGRTKRLIETSLNRTEQALLRALARSETAIVSSTTIPISREVFAALNDVRTATMVWIGASAANVTRSTAVRFDALEQRMARLYDTTLQWDAAVRTLAHKVDSLAAGVCLA